MSMFSDQALDSSAKKLRISHAALMKYQNSQGQAPYLIAKSYRMITATRERIRETDRNIAKYGTLASGIFLPLPGAQLKD